jgi:hypothetical protein
MHKKDLYCQCTATEENRLLHTGGATQTYTPLLATPDVCYTIPISIRATGRPFARIKAILAFFLRRMVGR